MEEAAAWEEKVELLRVSVALMAEVYAMGTISIYATAVSCFWKMQLRPVSVLRGRRNMNSSLQCLMVAE